MRHTIPALRKLMAEQGLSAYIIPATDPHMSEYLPEHWRNLHWASGFTGSAGTLVVTQDFAGVWTDSRYFVQAEAQLKGSGIELVKLVTPHTLEFVDWLIARLQPGQTVGVDGTMLSRLWYAGMEAAFKPHQIQLNPYADLVSKAWTNRPSLPSNPITEHALKFAGTGRKEKIRLIREQLAARKANMTILSTLDDIAWTFNLRGSDVPYNPLFIAHAVISEKEAALFVDSAKLSAEVKTRLIRDGIKLLGYQEITEYLAKVSAKSTVLIDPKRISQNLPGALPQGVRILEAVNITTWLKACKTANEAQNTRQTMIKDGVVLTDFFYWLSQNVGKQRITEIAAQEKLQEMRRTQKDNMGESFGTISAYGAHAALPHYSATPESDVVLEPKGMYLLDSGGQYLGGTTDTTRVIALGAVTEEEKTDYTLVLKGLIAVSRLRFPTGTRGYQIDALARQPQWQYGINFGHGTGHGVGYYLCVHEGPQSISPNQNATSILDAPMMPGMITSVEPGIYRVNKHGIRLENLVLCIEDIKTEFGAFLAFETLTLAPLFTNLVQKSLLNKEELAWLKAYNQLVYRKLSKFLAPEVKEWMKRETRI